MSDRLDYWLIQHIGMTHPPIWAMWFAIIASAVNLLWRKR